MNHVRGPQFGLNFDPKRFMEKLITNIKPLGPVDAHFLLHSLYNMEMGFFNHMDPVDAKRHPLAAVRAFKEEDPYTDSLMEDVAYRYRKNQIRKRFDINFLEYCKLPVTVTRQLDKIGDEVIKPIEREEEKAQMDALNLVDK